MEGPVSSGRPSLRQLSLSGQRPAADTDPAAKAAPSRLPVPGLRPKRPASGENEPPTQKRARGPPVSSKRGCVSVAAPSAASVRRSQHPSGRRRVLSRAAKEVATVPTTGRGRGCREQGREVAAPTLQQPASATAPQPAAVAMAAERRGERKRPAWDLKGQVSDLRAKESIYREKIQRLSGEKQALEHELAGRGQELKQVMAQNRELMGRASVLASELQSCQDQAQERLHRLTQLLAKERHLEETLQNQAQVIGKLEEANTEMKGVNKDLVAQLEAREVELHSAEKNLAWHQQNGEMLQTRLVEQEQQLHQLEIERRVLHNTVQELKGNIRVFCRVRPLLDCEKDAQKGMGHLHIPLGNKSSLLVSKTEESHVGRERKDDITYEFNFDRVFPPSSSQEEVFEEIALLVQSALDGYHVCIFAYGQTGSGKTYTMEGPEEKGPGTAGLIPRAVQHIFKASREMEGKGWKYHFTANFLEIYNEALRDLLVPRPERGSELEIRRVSQSTEELHVPGLSCVPVASEEEVLKLLQIAQAHRSVAKTTLNERSSRSHSLFQLHIEGHSSSCDLHTSSVLSLVDLAGSERLDKSLSRGERLKETQAINSSLSNLGLVIMALSNKEAYVPYRNSKLTYLLQNSLGGNSKMLMFVNISPLEENFAESLNSLRFAKKVNECVIGTAQANRK